MDAAGELIHPVDAVFDADPAVEAFAFQLGENGIVVVEPLSDLAVAEALSVAGRAAFFAAKVLDRALGEVAVARMHRDDAV